MSGSSSPPSSLSSSIDPFSPIHSREWDPRAIESSPAGAGDRTSTLNPAGAGDGENATDLASEGSSYSWLPFPLKKAVDYCISVSPWGEPTWLQPFEKLNTTELMPKDRLLRLKALIEEVQKLWFPCSVPEDRVLAVIDRLLANLPEALQPEVPVTTATGRESVQLTASTPFVVIEGGAGDSPREVDTDLLQESEFTRVDIDIRGNSREIIESIENRLTKIFSYKVEQAIPRIKEENFVSRCRFLNDQRTDLNNNLSMYKEYEDEASFKEALVVAFDALFTPDEQNTLLGFREDPINAEINTFKSLGSTE